MNAAALARAVADRTGIVVGAEQSLHRAIRRVTDRERALSGDELLERVVDEFTVKETWFMREDAPLRALPWHELLEQARRRGDDVVSVWSAACATGEEPYTLALLACEEFGTSTPPVRIVGSDVSAAALAAAAAGRYRDRSLRAVPPTWRGRWFTSGGELTVVSPKLRALVSFRRHNLVHDPCDRYDVVLCRNVLIYFDAQTASAVRTRLAAAVHPGGRLILGSADALCGVPAPVVAAPAARPRPRRRKRKQAAQPVVETPLTLFEHGLALLDRDDAAAAVEPLRRALYLDPTFALAAFQLGRAYDRLGQAEAAVRLYRQTLRTLAPDDVGDVASACRTRIRQEENR